MDKIPEHNKQYHIANIIEFSIPVVMWVVVSIIYIVEMIITKEPIFTIINLMIVFFWSIVSLALFAHLYELISKYKSDNNS